MDNTTNMVTSFEQLQEYAKGQIVRLPDIAEGCPFYARLKRPSLLGLISSGKVPNPLVTTANNLFAKGGAGVDPVNPKQMEELTKILHIFCESAFVEPTYDEIKRAGYELNDEQLMAVFNYVQKGNKALERFHEHKENPEHNRSGEKVQ